MRTQNGLMHVRNRERRNDAGEQQQFECSAARIHGSFTTDSQFVIRCCAGIPPNFPEIVPRRPAGRRAATPPRNHRVRKLNIRCEIATRGRSPERIDVRQNRVGVPELERPRVDALYGNGAASAGHAAPSARSRAVTSVVSLSPSIPEGANPVRYALRDSRKPGQRKSALSEHGRLASANGSTLWPHKAFVPNSNQGEGRRCVRGGANVCCNSVASVPT